MYHIATVLSWSCPLRMCAGFGWEELIFTIVASVGLGLNHDKMEGTSVDKYPQFQ